MQSNLNISLYIHVQNELIVCIDIIYIPSETQVKNSSGRCLNLMQSHKTRYMHYRYVNLIANPMQLNLFLRFTMPFALYA